MSSKTPHRSPTATQRHATLADVPFLAEICEIASKPPFERSFWDELTEPLGVSTRQFLEAVFAERASNWGNVEDFVVLEVDGEPAAAAAVFNARLESCDRRFLDLERLPAVAARLGWDGDAVAEFENRYNAFWGPPDPIFLYPQAPAIIESVAVLPRFRGLGLGARLIEEAIAEARRRGRDAIGVMVVHGNDRAQALYERYFKRWASFHAAYFDDKFPGITKYRSTL